MELRQRHQRPYQHLPHKILIEVLFFFFVRNDLLVQIAIGCKVHHNTQCVAVKKRLLITDDVLMVNTGKDANFIQGVFAFFLREILERNFF